MDTVLCGRDTAFVVTCPVKVGEFATEVDTKIWVVFAWAG
jgi:hypothetical protein